MGRVRNQKGFTAIEGLLIAIIVGLIGFVGWYVWSSQSKTNKILDSTNTGSVQPKKKNTTTMKTEASDPTANWKIFTSSKNSAGEYYELKYNPGWETKECEGGPGATNMLMLSDSRATLGACNSDNLPRIFVSNLVHGRPAGTCGPESENGINKSSNKVTLASGQSANRLAWTSSGEPQIVSGTKFICYATQGDLGLDLLYRQSPSGAGSTNLTTDFDLMVTKTLQFHP